MTHRDNTVAALKRAVAKIDGTQERLAFEQSRARLRLGIDHIDARLGGGLVPADMHEVRCSLSRDIGCATGFLLGLLSGLDDTRPIAWLGEPAITLDAGTLFPDGLAHFGADASRLVHVQPMQLNDCLWAAGEATRNPGLSAVIVHLKGNPETFDLSVSRELMLRAQTSGTPIFVLRQAGEEEASSAATRWHVKPAPSVPDELYQKGVGHMRLTLTLEKNRNGQTGQWLIAWNPKDKRFETARSVQHAARKTTTTTHSVLPLHPFADRQDRPPQVGQVLAAERKQKHA